MAYLIFLRWFFPLLLVGFALIKAKFYKPHTFNESAYSLSQSKAMQGLAALVIMFHHLAQHTCAPWLLFGRSAGLEPFLNVGYLMVCVFFFASGFGLYKSVKSKEDYMKHFFIKRFLPLIYFYVITNIIFLLVEKQISSYAWFMYAIAASYLGFFLAFRFIRNDNVAIIITAVFSIGYVYVTDFVIGYETYWFNSSLVFIAGILFAKFERPVMEFFKKFFWVVLVVLIVALVFGFNTSLQMDGFLGSSEATYNNPYLKLITALMQSLTGLILSLLLIVINLKIEYRNSLLGKMGSVTLGFYLIHPLFCDIFSWNTPFPDLRKTLYVKNIPLYVLVVFVTSIIATIILYWLYGLLNKLVSRTKKD